MALLFETGSSSFPSLGIVTPALSPGPRFRFPPLSFGSIGVGSAGIGSGAATGFCPLSLADARVPSFGGRGDLFRAGVGGQAAGVEPDSPPSPPTWFGGVVRVASWYGDSGFAVVATFCFVWRGLLAFFRDRVAAGFSGSEAVGWGSRTGASTGPASLVPVNKLVS